MFFSIFWKYQSCHHNFIFFQLTVEYKHAATKCMYKCGVRTILKICKKSAQLHVVVLGFYVPQTAKVIQRQNLGLKSHPKDWRSPGSNTRALVYKASSLTTTPRRLLPNYMYNYMYMYCEIHKTWPLNLKVCCKHYQKGPTIE